MEDGLRDDIVTRQLEEELARIGIDRARFEKLGPGEASIRLARYLAEVAARLVAPIS